MHVDFVHLADYAAFDVVGDEGFHIGPPVVWLN